MSITVEGLGNTVGAAVIPGGAVGAHSIEGDLDASGDTLLAVIHVTTGFATNANLTSEFSISGYNEITNTTTDTTGDFLVVLYGKAQGE